MNNIFKTVSNKLTGYAPRTKFSLGNTCRTKLSYNAGELVPVTVLETLPGDIWQLNLASLTTMQTPIAPIMDDIDQTFYLFYVPLRILDSNFERAIVISDWTGPVNSYLDTFTFVGSSIYDSKNLQAYLGLGINRSSLGHYVGLPIGVYGSTFSGKIITAPFKGVVSIWNYFFRDENYQTEKVLKTSYISTYSNDDFSYYFSVPYVLSSRTEWTGNGSSVNINGCLPIVNEFHDPFTSVLPSPQKGAAVTLPLGSTAPVVFENRLVYLNSNDPILPNSPLYTGNSILETSTPDFKFIKGGADGSEKASGNLVLTSNHGAYVDLRNATASTINTLREAVLMQQFLEKLARSGSRYKEFILAFYNSDIADGRLQKPEFIAEHRCSINVSEVIQTSGYNSADSTTLGTLGARSRTGNAKDGFATFATPEHGYLYLFTVVRHRLSYAQGIHPMFFRKNGLDFYNPAWEGQGEVGVKTMNILANVGYHPDIMKSAFVDAGKQVTFDSELGFNEPFWEYKFFTQRAVGMMNPVASDGLDYWTLTKTFTSNNINASTLRVSSPDYLDRALSIHHDVSDQFIMDCLLTGSVVRRMRYRSTPGQFLRV